MVFFVSLSIKQKDSLHCIVVGCVSLPLLAKPTCSLSPFFSFLSSLREKTQPTRKRCRFSERFLERKREKERKERERELCCGDAETLIPNAPVQPATKQRALDAVAAAVAAPLAEAPPRREVQGRAVLSEPGERSDRRAAAQLDVPLCSASTTGRFSLRSSHLHLRNAPLHGNGVVRRRSGN